jgi:hypothetical protein
LQDEAVDLVLEALRVLVDCESSNEIEHGDAADLPLTQLHAHDYILSHLFALVGSPTLAPEGEGRKVRHYERDPTACAKNLSFAQFVVSAG